MSAVTTSREDPLRYLLRYPSFGVLLAKPRYRGLDSFTGSGENSELIVGTVVQATAPSTL